MRGQRGNIFRAIAERRQVDGENGQAIPEIFAKSAFGDHRLQVAMGGGDDADIDMNLALAADALERAVLQNAQIGGLERRAEVRRTRRGTAYRGRRVRTSLFAGR